MVQNLRIPGPTPCPPEVLAAMGRQMINHRGGEFAEIIKDVTAKMKQVFQTKNDLMLLTGSGTAGLEAAVVNMLSPGDTVLGVAIGVFGERFAKIAQTFGATVIPLNFQHGKAADPALIKKALDENPQIKAVLVTHNETSTGVTNDLAIISKVVKSAGKLLLVDCISSLGSVNVPVDEWGIDVAISGSQKGWMVPPGMAMVAVSEAGWQAYAQAKMPRFYWDLAKAKAGLEKGQTPWTPNVSVVFAFQVALDMMLKEGIDTIFARHQRIGRFTREGIKALGLTLLADEKHASNTVTSVVADRGLDAKKLNKIMKDEFNIVLAGGQGPLEGKIFRVGHLGMVNEKDIQVVFDALKVALPKAGFVG
ncbi:pyridoxal-phosphate-dependent aminotransferase family protein [Dehalogenimonas alkenigignens]|uniref:L-aspartate aminotransferase apoenzyme/phosphoserine aminotransferase apoenzyme n=1 Tax=Dehalogenimonas alkenigignens TaxID=1217799 RepID=A0A0W0GIW5_9CHLR|nr:alanine--glyoxylate aminotransferase family protein [Dehalogenimonas alkenigignens]KTB48481.1 L-aspartate aminotransferase apoenzyme/phosphoserine aminotransferase apoenzyme [Dehalogenimonas alkenigignens]PVV85069.1 alanine--glyoxylate aminotransferase family protein [Dehalogenimonas alkenigignens]